MTVSSPDHIKSEVRVTTDLGTYRVLRLQPSSNYTVQIELGGFATRNFREVNVHAGQQIEINAILSPSAVQETVTVIGETPLVDIKSAQQMRTLERDRIDNIPLGRGYQHLLISMAGVIDTEYSDPNQSVLGSDPRGNLYTIDGALANDTTVGYILFDVPVDMIEEVQVTSSGATAEFGNSNGGVFNFVTKSGGNEFSGGGYYFYQGEDTEWSNVTPELLAELGARSSVVKDTDVGGTFGGPIKKDAVWFFGHARYLENSVQTPLIPAQPHEITSKEGFFKVTGQIGDNTRAFGSATIRNHLRFPSNVSNFTRAGDPRTWDSRFRKQKVLNLGLTQLIGTDTIVDLRWNRQFKELIHDQPNNPDQIVGVRDIATGLFSGGLTRRPDHPSCRCAWGAGANVSHFRENAAGSHELKAGFYMDRPNSEKFFAFPNGEDVDLQTFDGAPFRVVMQNLPFVQRRAIDRYAAFVQDQWTIGDRLTLNLGVRWENTEAWLPETSSGGGRWFPETVYPETRDAINWNVVAPRLGMVYALGEEKRTSLKAYYGRHYRSMLNVHVGPLSPSAGGSATYTWNDLNGDLQFQDGEQGTLIRAFDERRLDPDFGSRVELQRDLTQSYVDAFHFTVEHELNTNTVVSVGASFKQDKNIIETIRVREGGDQQNPFNDYRELQVENQWDQTPLTIYALRPEFLGASRTDLITNPDFASTGGLFRDYKGIEFRAHRRFRDGWQLAASYNFSETYGNIANDFAGTSSTNVIYRNPNATIVHNEGPLQLDAPHQFKLQGTYTLPGDVLVSGFFQAVSGFPHQTKKEVSGLRLGEGNYVSQYFPICAGTGATKAHASSSEFGCRTLAGGGIPGIVVEGVIQVPSQPKGTFRHDFRNKLDLRVEKQFRFGDNYRLGLILDMFNVTNINRITAYQSMTIGLPQFLKPAVIELPRVLRFGIRFNF